MNDIHCIPLLPLCAGVLVLWIGFSNYGSRPCRRLTVEQADDVLKCFASLNVYDESEPWIFKTCDMRQVPFTVDCVAIAVCF